jgi:hypothetical protein
MAIETELLVLVLLIGVMVIVQLIASRHDLRKR